MKNHSFVVDRLHYPCESKRLTLSTEVAGTQKDGLDIRIERKIDVKMIKRENYLYVGMDLHKETHTAVLLNCWNEKLGTITIENKASEFDKLVKIVNKNAVSLSISPIFGLENANGYGRSLSTHLLSKGFVVKDINPALAYDQRKSNPTFHKSDEFDAYAVATVLINHLHKLPDATSLDNHWTLKTLVNRRDLLVKEATRIKHGLHEQVSNVYPSYKKFFSEIDGKTALYFWKNYPSPVYLHQKDAEELLAEFKEIAKGIKITKVETIFSCIKNDGKIEHDFQESRDFLTKSLVRDLIHHADEIKLIDAEIKKMIDTFDYKLMSMPGIGVAIASKLIAEIGDINRFPNADKLARYSGVAPVRFSSAGKGKEEKSRQGNRTLHGIFYFLAVSMVTVPVSGIPNQPVFYEYYQRKISEGKTKSQALICIMRRLVNIVYGMMKNKSEYRAPQTKEILQ